MNRPSLVIVAAVALACWCSVSQPSGQSLISGAAANLGVNGPLELGPLDFSGRIGAVPIRSVLAKIGNPPLPAADVVCYKDVDSGDFLWLARGADDQQLVRGVGLAKFRNCAGAPVYSASNFGRWFTKEHIGLGSSVAAVLSAYGPPKEVYNKSNRPEAYFDSIGGPGDPRGASVPPGWSVLRYGSTSDQLYVAEFGIVSERVFWIWISDNE